MKLKPTTLYILLFYLMIAVHFGIWIFTVNRFEVIFMKYYLFLAFLFMIVFTILSIIKRIYPNYVGFAFLGLMMFKLAMMFIIMKKLNLSEVPGYKYHFIPPYLISLALETLFAIHLIKQESEPAVKDEKNQ